MVPTTCVASIGGVVVSSECVRGVAGRPKLGGGQR